MALENVNLCLSAVSEVQVMSTYPRPALRLLVNIQAASNLDSPSIREPDLSIMHVVIELNLQCDAYVPQAFNQIRQFILNVVLLFFIL